MYYVYIIKSKNYPNQIYKGFTTNLKDRLQRHNRGEIAHTSKYYPWELVFYAGFKDQGTATQFERYLKSGSGVAFTYKRLI